MSKRTKNLLISAAITIAAALLLIFAGYFPFKEYSEPVYTSSLENLFSADHLASIVPFIVIIIDATAIILLILFIRNYHAERKGINHRKLRKGGKYSVNKMKSKYMLVRWCVMTGFMLLTTFGGIIIGARIPGIAIPILSCEANTQQLFESSCYYLAHLDLLFSQPIGKIITFIVSTLVFILFFGRILCGFLCPMGLIQDVMHAIRQKTGVKGIRFNEKRYGILTPVKWMLLLLMFGVFIIGGDFCEFCPAVTMSPVFAGMKVSIYFSGFMMIITLIASFFKRRFWCNICPLGFLLGLTHKLSLFKLKKDTTACTECGACYEACPMGIKMIYTEREKIDVTDANCIMCGECVKCCPEDNALAITFAGKKIYNASRKNLMAGCAGRNGRKRVWKK